jgi:hypothetical protein
LHALQKRRILPCGQPLHAVQYRLTLPCAQPEHCAHSFFVFPCACGHGEHVPQSHLNLPCGHRFRVVTASDARPSLRSPNAAIASRRAP